MKTRLRERPSRRPSWRYPWSLQPVSRIVGQRPLDFIRQRAWTATPTHRCHGISAVSSLSLLDESTAGGPSLLIAGDEDGGVSVQRVPAADGGLGEAGTAIWSACPNYQRARLHDSCVNTIKVLPDQRGFVCAGDDGILNAVATLEGDIQRATLALTGHSGFVTDCDTATSGHAILSSSTDGRMLLWDPMASSAPVASVSVGRPLNSACFSAGDPYALICAPELGGGPNSCSPSSGSRSSGGGSSCGSEDLAQIWDLRSLRCYREAVPAAIRTAFGESSQMCTLQTANMQPPSLHLPEMSMPTIWADGESSGRRRARSSNPRGLSEDPSWLTATLGSSEAASPATPLLRRSAWTECSSDNESLPSESRLFRGRGVFYPSLTPESTGKENGLLDSTLAEPGSESSTPGLPTQHRSTCHSQPADCQAGGNWEHGSSSLKSIRKPMSMSSDGPSAVFSSSALPMSQCLHEGHGKIWMPNMRRARPVTTRRRRRGCQEAELASSVASESSLPTCSRFCSGRATASAFALQVSSDGRRLLIASKDATVTLWDAQSKEVVFRFGNARLSPRARPILWEGASSEAGRGWGRAVGESSVGDIFAGTKDGDIRAWRVGSQFPNRLFKCARRHEGFEVTCLAVSRDGSMFASADSSGKICVQSATATGFAMDE